MTNTDHNPSIVPHVSAGTLRRHDGGADHGAGGALGHAVVSHPAAVHVHAVVAHDFLVPALGGGGGVAGGRADGALGHAVVSHPAPVPGAHVASLRTLSYLKYSS